MFNKGIIPILTILFIFSCSRYSQGLKKDKISPLVNNFLQTHVQYKKFDDELSKRTLKLFVKSLDYGKYYFLQSDIDKFSKYETKIDNYVKDENYKFLKEIFKKYKTRVSQNKENMNFLIKQKFDFSKDEKMIVDRELLKYAKSKKELKERLRKSIKLQLLNYISSGKKLKEAKVKLNKKYKLLYKRIENINEEELNSKFVKAFAAALDPHSSYLTQDEHDDFMISMKLKLEGIGAQLRSEDGYVIIQSIIHGGAADKLKNGKNLKPNDKITAVAQGDGEAVDVIDMDLRDVVKKIRGKKGTEVRLTILRELGKDNKAERLIIPIIREEIKLTDKDAESDVLKIKGKTIGYIKLPSFYSGDKGKTSLSDMVTEVNKMINQNVHGIILDLRGNPGGALDHARDIAGLFIKNGPIVQIKNSKSQIQTLVDFDNSYFPSPMVVLIDGFSASASEILAGALKDYKRAIIIGPRNTFGKGTVQSYNPLGKPIGGAVKITTHIFYQPGGSSNQLDGVAPDITIPDLSVIWDIGESKTKYPLKWKKIPKAHYRIYPHVNDSIISKLTKLSKKRVNNDKEFKKIKKQIKEFKKQINNKTISLKEESKFEKEKKKNIEKKLEKKESKKVLDLKNDPFLREAFNITADYVKILK